MSTVENDSVVETGLHDLEGKYITFHLDEEEYGLPILNIREIIGMMKITAVPKTPDWVSGVVNLRGNVISVIDLRVRFGLELKETTDRTPIIVVEVPAAGTLMQMGIIVDAVSEVINVISDNLANTPSFGVEIDTDFILGMAKISGNVKTLLDINKVLTSKEMTVVESAGGQQKQSDGDGIAID